MQEESDTLMESTQCFQEIYQFIGSPGKHVLDNVPHGQCHVCIKVYLFHREQQVVVFVPLLILMYEAPHWVPHFSSTIDLIPLG